MSLYRKFSPLFQGYIIECGLGRTMRHFTAYFIFTIVIGIAAKSVAQRSCIYLPEPGLSSASENEYDRPQANLRRIHPLSPIQPQSIINSAPDFPNINVSSFLLQDQNETSIA